MNHLFLDTSTERGIIGLGKGHELLEEVFLPIGLHNSKFLVPSLLDLLKRNQISLKNLEFISCGIGPGSYTGIRVGAALAQSIAYALKLPLIGFSSLEAFIPSNPFAYAAILDAKYAGVYLQKGEFDGKTNRMLSDPEVVSLGELLNRLEDIQLLVTPHQKLLQERFKDLTILWEERGPSGKIIAHRSYERFLKKDFSNKLTLLYLRKTQAERSLDGS